MEEGLGRKNWLKLIGGLVLMAVAVLVLFLILGRLFWGLGLFGALFGLAAILLLVAWLFDKREEAKRQNV